MAELKKRTDGRTDGRTYSIHRRYWRHARKPSDSGFLSGGCNRAG